MSKTTSRIYDEQTVGVLRRAKALLNRGTTDRDAFGLAPEEMEQRQGQHHD